MIDVFIDPEKPKEYFCIGMEDLNVSGFETCDQITGMKWNDCMLMAEYVGKFHAKYWQSDILRHPVICSGKPEVAAVWFEIWGRTVPDAPQLVDTLISKLNPVAGNPNLPMQGGHVDMFPTDETKKMIALWKKHGKAICDEYHEVLDSRPFTLIHGDLRADNIFRKGKNGEATALKFIDWQTYSAAPPGVEMCQMLTGSMLASPDMDHLFDITRMYIETLHANCEAAKEYTHDMLIEDYAMTQSMLYCGVAAPFAGLLESLPDGHPLWVLVDACFDRLVKAVGMLDCAGVVIRTADKLGLAVDPELPWYTPPAEKPMETAPTEPELHRIHVRGIGVDGWDGTEEGVGTYENEASLKEIFGLFGTVKAVVLRHRIDKNVNANTSWALVELDTSEAVDAVMAAVAPPRALLAGSNVMKVTKFSKKIADESTGGMRQALHNINSLVGAAMIARTQG